MKDDDSMLGDAKCRVCHEGAASVCGSCYELIKADRRHAYEDLVSARCALRNLLRLIDIRIGKIEEVGRR